MIEQPPKMFSSINYQRSGRTVYFEPQHTEMTCLNQTKKPCLVVELHGKAQRKYLMAWLDSMCKVG